MVEITVDQNQAELILQASGTVVVRGPNGQMLGHISRDFSADEIEAVRRRMHQSGPVLSTQQVLEHLRTLATE